MLFVTALDPSDNVSSVVAYETVKPTNMPMLELTIGNTNQVLKTQDPDRTPTFENRHVSLVTYSDVNSAAGGCKRKGVSGWCAEVVQKVNIIL